ncbi:hypothetical protein MRX96_051289 [Rhipicephalus microplus]
MAHRTLTFIKAPLYNGVGRYVCQLQRLTLTFCKTHGSSRFMREYIERDLVNFARDNPGVVVYLKPRRHRDPLHRGRPIARINKYHRTEHPSIQGFWTPFTNRPTEQNLCKFPNEELSEFKSVFPTATEQLQQLAAQDSQETSETKE